MSRKVPAGNTPMLETERLLLRPLSADKVGPLHRISNEPSVRLHLWDNEQVSEATIKGLIAQSDRMFSIRENRCIRRSDARKRGSTRLLRLRPPE
jgi:RimJ/RimL family protein N-acetyltransferase